MARPLRIEFEGAVYHVTSRGDRREEIYADDEDRRGFLEILGEVVTQMRWLCYAYCLMPNHYHLVIETPEGNLSRGMRQLNGIYTQWSNRRHRRVGHLFQGRYKAIVVDRDAYLLALLRYVVLNPVRVGLVKAPADWPWSSYNATVEARKAPKWLATDAVLAQFGGRRSLARCRYAEFVDAAPSDDNLWQQALRGQIYLGDGAFVERMQGRLGSSADDVNVPRAERRPVPPPLSEMASRYASRNDAMVAAYETGDYTQKAIGDFFGMHFSTVGRIVRQARQGKTT